MSGNKGVKDNCPSSRLVEVWSGFSGVADPELSPVSTGVSTGFADLADG
jgi:hypothetical protein